MAMKINLTCPAGTYGLAVEPWAEGEIYAVAADWAEASDPVMAYGPGGWNQQCSGPQVATYRHRPEDALRAEIRHAIATSEGIPSDEVDDDEVERIVADAVEIGDAE
jgi:hypothetical protein